MLRIASWFLLICAALSSFGCDESLPPYSEPTAVLKADMYALVPLSVNYKEYAWSDYGFLPDNTTKFRISAVNTYEETFQGPLEVKGRLEVWPVLSKSDIDRIPVVWPGEMPSTRAVIPITKYNIISTWLIDPTKTTLTMKPGDKVMFAVDWAYAVGLTNVLFFLPVESEIINTKTIERVYRKTVFRARATVQLFKGAAPIVSPEIEFSLTFSGTVYLTRP